jgi:carbon monoxide dehydrogenase subunit G
MLNARGAVLGQNDGAMLPRIERPGGIRAAALVALIFSATGAFAAETEIRLMRRPDKTYEVSGQFTVAASTAVVWDVLTDYENIPAFVSSMRSSRVRETRGDGSIVVEQRAVGDMFFLSKTMRILLEVRRGPEQLQFTDIGRQDFRIYDGDWEARQTAEGVGVAYHLLVQPHFPAPSFVMNRVMKGGARKLLEQVRAEMVRRELARRIMIGAITESNDSVNRQAPGMTFIMRADTIGQNAPRFSRVH